MSKTQRYVLCIENRGHAETLEARKIYRMIDDADAETRGLVRVVDESGEDDLYPSTAFVPIEVPRAAVKAFAKKTA
jgi:hypothetical protein